MKVMKGTINLHEEWGWGVISHTDESIPDWIPLHPDDLTYFAEMNERFDNFEARVLSSPEVEFEIIINNKFTGKIIYAKLNTKEEPKQESPEEPTMIDDWLNEYGDPEIYKKVERELELREAAENYSLELLAAKTIQPHEKTWIKSMFIHIAKGQAERMYSEEEVLSIQEKYNEYIQKNFNPEFSILPFKVFFEQFKKK
jgi:hypothetical protein